MDKVAIIEQQIKESGYNIGCISKELNTINEKTLRAILYDIKNHYLNTHYFKGSIIEIEYPEINNELDITMSHRNKYGWDD